MRFSTRIILTVGLSTMILTSLYWLAGWHYVEELEDQQRSRLQEFIGERTDQVVKGDLSPQTLELLPGIRLYMAKDSWPDTWPDISGAGIYPLEEGAAVMVRNLPGTRQQYAVYLPAIENLFEQEESEVLEAIVVAGGVLLFTLGAMGLTLWLLWKQTVPLRQLTLSIANVSPESPELEPLQRSDEVGELSRQFSHLLARTQSFIQREQNFTRFASHELRTPLMTLTSTLALMKEMAESPLHHKALLRMELAVDRMENLTSSFLWLSREDRGGSQSVDRKGFKAILEQLQQLTPALADIQFKCKGHDWKWNIHPFVLSVMLDNLLRNALDHGDTGVLLEVSESLIRVSNPVADSDPSPIKEEDHFGYGLLIVEQLCEKANAHFHYWTESGRFVVEVCFQKA